MVIDIALLDDCSGRNPGLKGFQHLEAKSIHSLPPHQSLVRVYNRKAMTLPRNKRILLVDDDASLRATLRTCLEMVGYQCIEAMDGHDARRWLEHESPDVVVTDHQMPRVAGLELIKDLENQKHTEAVPIIFYSGQLTADLKAQGIQAGVSAVLDKPFSLREFLDLIVQFCEKPER